MSTQTRALALDSQESQAVQGGTLHKEGGQMTLAFDGAGGIMRGRSREVEVPFTELMDLSSVGVITAPLLHILIRLPMSGATREGVCRSGQLAERTAQVIDHTQSFLPGHKDTSS